MDYSDALSSVFSDLAVPVLLVENCHVGFDWVVEGFRGYQTGEEGEREQEKLLRNDTHFCFNYTASIK